MTKKNKLGLIFITPVFILLSHYLAVFPHEYVHSFMAWILGYKSNPFAIDYGGTSWLNLLLLLHIDENKIQTTLGKAALMIISVGILFGFFGMPGFFNYGEISYFLSATSLLAIPGIIIVLSPQREWVKRRVFHPPQSRHL